jgi:hypothetical protein
VNDDERDLMDIIEELIDLGVLGEELPKGWDYRHWPVLQSDRLPHFLKADYEEYGEIRWE